MAEDEEYEVLPHQILEDLKEEVEALKKKLSQPDTKTQELILEMESLKDALRDLQDVFHKALELSKGEDVTQTVSSLKEKIEAVVHQNETIAKALLSISDKLEEGVARKVSAMPSPSAAPASSYPVGMGLPQLPGQRTAPRPMSMPSMFPSAAPAPMPVSDFPPPPVPPMKRKGLF